MMTEKMIIGNNSRYPLDGMLTLPSDSAGPFPAVVFVHGSGSSDMDERIGKLAPFKDLAEGLAKHGIASVRYNKRTYSHAAMMARDFGDETTVREEVIDDAIIATALLRRDSRIDPDNIFVIGHSLGGMLAPRIDAEGGDFRGLVIMAGTPRRMEKVMIEQNEEAYANMGGLMKRMARNKIQEANEVLLGLDRLSDEEAKTKKLGGSVTLYYFKEMGRHPASEYLLSSDKPVLIMQGGRDFQIKADKDFEAYKKLLRDRPNVSYRLYKDLNHAFVPAIHDSISDAKKEYAVERHIDDTVISDIAKWILAETE